MDPNALSPLERRSAFSLSSIFALRMLGLFLILPVFAIYARELPGGNNAFYVGLALGIYGLTQGSLMIPYGVVSDRIGRRPVIIFGLVVFGLGSAFCALSSSIEMVILGRALQGAGAISGVVTAMIAESVRERVLTKAMALVGASIGATFAFSLVASPILTSAIGVPGLFWMTAVLSGLAIVSMLTIVPEPGRSLADGAMQEHAPWYRVVFMPDLVRLDLGIFILHIVQMALFVVIPPKLTTLGLLSANHWYVYLPAVLASFVFMMPAINMAQRRNAQKQLFLLCILILLCAYAGFYLFFENIPSAGLLILVFFSAFNILEAMLPSFVSRFSPPADKGLALGVYNTTQSIGLFVGGASGGWLAANYGTQSVYLYCMCLIGLWLALAFFMKKLPTRKSSRRIV